ncbi:MAG TPA: HEPN domain-containing protein [Vicinamibacterales bacterium]|nr:HEPN domain-containing protein [Vicinamibacterales bacterium]
MRLAKEQLEDAQVAAWEPEDAAECVTNAFYAYENAVTAAMIAVGRKRTRKHSDKSAAATELFKDNKLKTDVGGLLEYLNDTRKDVQYETAGAELLGLDLEELVSNLETFIDDVDDLLDQIEQG